ncbi:MAG: DUF4392 domain-containing protein [Lachnospiraceae bacterium]|nr:DUF4392 domain-containing protein [Lachnospiraceae bacterium]
MTKRQTLQWETIGNKIAKAVQTDPGGRGLLKGEITTPVSALLQSLEQVPRAVLLTGFPVRLPDGTVVGETDGPSGLANIAWALEQTGTAVRVLTDRTCFRQLEAAMRARGCSAAPEMIPEDGQEPFLEELFAEFSPTHLITLERPGKARDGHFHNMRGGVIDPMITDADCILETARRCGAEVISVGDGGNELGMGALRPLIEERVPLGELICADAPADIALVSGVSNWWSWGIAAFLSLLHKKDLLPSPETELAMLHAVIISGGADGCTARIEETVDDLPPEVHLAVLNNVREQLRA